MAAGSDEVFFEGLDDDSAAGRGLVQETHATSEFLLFTIHTLHSHESAGLLNSWLNGTAPAAGYRRKIAKKCYIN